MKVKSKNDKKIQQTTINFRQLESSTKTKKKVKRAGREKSGGRIEIETNRKLVVNITERLGGGEAKIEGNINLNVRSVKFLECLGELDPNLSRSVPFVKVGNIIISISN